MTPSSSKRLPKKTVKASDGAWSLFLSTSLFLLMVLVMVYLFLAIYLTWKYFSARRQVDRFSLRYLQQMSRDLDTQYDFTKDDLAVRHTNSKLAKDLTDGLLRYYENNLQTVMNVVHALDQVLPQDDDTSNGKGPDIVALKSHAQDFVVLVSKNVKASVINESNYLVRFFSMLIHIVPLDSTENVIRELKDFLQELLSHSM